MAGQILPSLVHGMARARRSQELSQWRQPIDLASMVWQARAELPSLLEQGSARRGHWHGDEVLASQMLGDSPSEVIGSIKQAIVDGATAEQIGAAVAHASFLRMAHFHLSNEFRDWDTVHNTLTAANALHQALKRTPTPELLRGAFDVAISIYLDRFLNMPPQRIPDTAASSERGAELLERLLEMVNVPPAGGGIGAGGVRLPVRRQPAWGSHGEPGKDDAARRRGLPLVPDR